MSQQPKRQSDKDALPTTHYLEQCLDQIEGLPSLIRTSFQQLGQLDRQAAKTQAQVDDIAEKYLETVHFLTPLTRAGEMATIQGLFAEGQECADRKVQLVENLYQTLDQRIVQFDVHLKRLELQVKANSAMAKRLGPGDSSNAGASGASGAGGAAAGGAAGGAAGVGGGTDGADAGCASADDRLDVLEMPVDPNEPTFCVCHEVAYGQMVGCDNKDCPIEWFHFSCMGLRDQPPGAWFCPNCTKLRKSATAPATAAGAGRKKKATRKTAKQDHRD